MIVKPDCPVKLTSFQAHRILTQLRMGNYFQSLKGGAETLPPFSGFVKEFDNIAKQFFLKTEYNLQNFINDTHNAAFIGSTFKQLFAETSQKDVDHLALLKDAVENNIDSIEENEIVTENNIKSEENDIVEIRQGYVDLEAIAKNREETEFFETEFENASAFYRAMFNKSNYIESKFKTYFSRDVFIRSVLIDPVAGTITNTQGIEGEIEINKNLKDKRKEILYRLLERHKINKVEKFLNPITGEELTRIFNITPELAMSNPKMFNYLLEELSNRVTNPSYNGATINLLEGNNSNKNSLYSIAREADDNQNEEASKIVSDYLDYVALKQFDNILRLSFGQYLNVSEDLSLNNFNEDLKYRFIVNLKEEAQNSNYSEEIKGLETISDLYNVIVTNTPILDINTGLPTKDFLSKSNIQKAFDKFFDLVKVRDSVRSIKKLVIEGMHDTNSLWEDRNILYTIYKNFFENYGDSHNGNNYNVGNQVEADALANDVYPKSYLQTLLDNNLEMSHPLMQLIIEPIKTIGKVRYAEATVRKDGTVGITELSATGKTSTQKSVEQGIFNRLNLKEKVLENIEKYQPTGGTTLESSVEFNYNGNLYVIKGYDNYSGNAIDELPQDLIYALSKDLLGVNFEGSSVDRDFKNELMSREQGGTNSSFPNYYVQFLRQAFKVLVAKNAVLTDNEVRTLLTSKKPELELATSNSFLNSLFGEGVGKLYANTLDSHILRFNKQDTLQPVLDAYTASKNRITGNSAKSVLTNKEKNAIAAYSKYNLFIGLNRSLIDARETHNSILNNRPSKNVFATNALIQDPNLFKGLTYRDAIEVNGRIIPNSKQTALTSLHFDINGGYFSLLHNAQKNGKTEVIIDPTVYSDKSKNALAIFGNDFTFEGESYNLFTDDMGRVVDENQSIELLYRTNGQYYKRYGENLLEDWLKVINRALSETGKPLLDINGETTSNKLKRLNEFNSGSFWYDGSAHPFLKGRDAAQYYADRAGVILNNYVHYQGNGLLTSEHATTPLVIKKSLIDEIALYDHEDSSKLKNWLDSKLLTDVNTIRKATNFTLVGDSVKYVDKHYQNLSKFAIGDGKNKQYDIAETSLKNITDVDQILPAYRKFFYDWNFLSENLLNVALGNIHAHKGGNANKAWTAMTKRNVMAGATIRPYALGLEKGVEEFTRSAFIDDVVTPILTIHGEQQVITDLDGGEFVTMTQRLKTYESLNQQYQGDGGPEQKPFGSVLDFISGQSEMKKLASFVLDKETIRNSIGSDIDFMQLHKDHLYNYPISHLDVTKGWKNGVSLENLDIYVYRRDFNHTTGKAGHIVKLHSIKNIGGNTYNILKSDPATNGTFTDTVTLNTWFDLWQTLGDIDTVSPSKKKTSIYYTTDSGVNVYFDESNSSWEKLLDFEAYIGNPEHKSIKPNYITATGFEEVDSVYALYKELTNEHDVVEPLLEMMADVAADYALTEDEYNATGLQNVTPYNNFMARVGENATEILSFFEHFIDQVSNPETRELMTTWQPVKGKLIEALTTAGAVKVGQKNINRSTVYSAKAKAEYTAQVDAIIQEIAPLKARDSAFIAQLIENGEIIKDCN